jgi:hypothetical protein
MLQLYLPKKEYLFGALFGTLLTLCTIYSLNNTSNNYALSISIESKPNEKDTTQRVLERRDCNQEEYDKEAILAVNRDVRLTFLYPLQCDLGLADQEMDI